jgi:hypothetical protein
MHLIQRDTGPRGPSGQHVAAALGVGGTGRDAVHGHAVRGVLNRQQLGRGGDRGAQHHRDGQVRLWLADRRRRDEHQPAEPSCRHARQSEPGQPQRPE